MNVSLEFVVHTRTIPQAHAENILTRSTLRAAGGGARPAFISSHTTGLTFSGTVTAVWRCKAAVLIFPRNTDTKAFANTFLVWATYQWAFPPRTFRLCLMIPQCSFFFANICVIICDEFDRQGRDQLPEKLNLQLKLTSFLSQFHEINSVQYLYTFICMILVPISHITFLKIKRLRIEHVRKAARGR